MNVTRVDVDIPEDGFEEQSFELSDNFDIDQRINVMPESTSGISKFVVLFCSIASESSYKYAVVCVL